MRFIPILFSTEMVQAILDGRKTQTRRVVKSNGVIHTARKIVFEDENWQGESGRKIKCPYGQPGDVLWLRETWSDCTDRPDCPAYKAGKDGWEAFHGDLKWKPSIHMPKAACRLFLRVKSVRVERLQDISTEDAMVEGIEFSSIRTFPDYKDYLVKSTKHAEVFHLLNPRLSFQTLWQSINGEESWNSNPWMWVIEFERIEKPENFC